MPVVTSGPARSRKVGMISLGCAKNLVDAEIMLGDAINKGFEITKDPDEADVLIVNTCAFIDSAKEESIEAILDSHQQRGLTKRLGQKLIVSGCMSQRFSKELVNEIPEVDAFIGLDQISKVGTILETLFEKEKDTPAASPLDLVTPKSTYIPDYDTPRYRLTPSHSAYVKIAEGCNHPCSFCVIPQMRGRHRSRTIDSVTREITQMVGEGVREFNLISQDTTYFGMDLWEQKAGPRQPVDSTRGQTLTRLLEEIGNIEGDFWVRLLYTHPAHWSEELMDVIANHPKVVPYVDMPLQHIHEEMLKTMRRETSRQHIEDLIVRLREKIPGLAIRTTFIAGFPGETDEQFESLLEFIEKVRFERLGVFKYSQEEGSRAGKMENQISNAVKNKRHRKAMLLQQRIAAEIANEQVGKTVKVLVERARIGRTEHDAPEVDTQVILESDAPVGSFIRAKVTGTQVYDLIAKPV